MDRFDALLAPLDGRREAMLEQVLAWSAINSGSLHREGLARQADALADAFGRTLGVAVTREALAPQAVVDARGEPVERPLGELLRLRQRPQAPWQVLLVGHYDTVFGADHAFQAPRRVDADTVNGPGVADLKGGLVVMLHALQVFEASPWAGRLGWEVILNPDEEIGSPGSAPHLAAAAQRHHLGLVYEPALADGTLAGARKGSGNFSLVVRGRGAHAGRDHARGRNAVVAAAEFAADIARWSGVLPGVTVNPAALDGGSAVNVVPERAVLRFNVRVASGDEQAWVEARLAERVAALNAREGYAATLHGGFGRPPKVLDARQQVLYELVRDCGEHLGLALRWQPTGGCCDGNNLAAAGLPNVDTLGVRGGEIHSEREFLCVDSLTERARLSALLLLRLAAGEIDGAPFARGEPACC